MFAVGNKRSCSTHFSSMWKVLQRRQGQAPVRDLIKANEVIDEIKQHEDFTLTCRVLDLTSCGLIGVSDAGLGGVDRFCCPADLDSKTVKVYSQAGIWNFIGEKSLLSLCPRGKFNVVNVSEEFLCMSCMRTTPSFEHRRSVCAKVLGCSAKRSRVLLTQDLADQIADLPRFLQVKSQFQFRVPVGTFRDFSKEDATTAATEQSPGLVTARGSFESLCPRQCHRGGSAKLGEKLLVSFCDDKVPNGAVWYRAVVKRVSWEHWLRTLRRLPHRRALHSHVRAVVCPERYPRHEVRYCFCKSRIGCNVVI